MSNFTKEQLIEKLKHRISVASGFPDSEKAQMDLELARIALASLEAEAVGEVVLGEYDDCGCHPDAKVVCIAADGQADWGNFKDGTPLYTAPPAPASVPECFKNAVSSLESLYRNGQKQNWNERYTTDMAYASGILRACRDAMLQGADGKPELTVWYGSMPESNGKANWTAIMHRKGEGRCIDGFTIDRSEYPGRVLYAADRVRYLIGEKSERPSILDYDADAHSGYVKPGNSPGIPDGWVACSERMPEVGVKVLCFPVNDEPIHATYNGQVWLQDISWSVSDEPIDNVISCNVFHWMPLPAAPQQEVK